VGKITDQITVKLNAKKFRPLLEKLESFAGKGITECNSDLVGKALFFCYYSIYDKKPDCNDKTTFQIISEMTGMEKPEMLLNFLQAYSEFKKQGLK
jgi:hypothetical protein